MVEITEEEYVAINERRKPLSPLESFTDLDGSLPYGFGAPYYCTVWGVGDEKILKFESRKINGEWVDKYYKY